MGKWWGAWGHGKRQLARSEAGERGKNQNIKDLSCAGI
jgi:hypothetical protein